MTIRANAIIAINAYSAGEYETLAEAATARAAKIEVVNVLYKNEDLLPPSAFVHDTIQASREAKCRSCVKFTVPNMCSECGCPIVFFSSQASSVCPIGAWS